MVGVDFVDVAVAVDAAYTVADFAVVIVAVAAGVVAAAVGKAVAVEVVGEAVVVACLIVHQVVVFASDSWVLHP